MTKKYNSCISNNLASNGDEMKKLIGAEVKSLQNMVSRHIENKEKEMGKDRVSAPNLFILKFYKKMKGKRYSSAIWKRFWKRRNRLVQRSFRRWKARDF